MNRRHFIKNAMQGVTAACGAGWAIQAPAQPHKTHIITLSFDDGFRKSFFKVAEIHEKYGLSACLNVIASVHLPGYRPADQYLLPEVIGTFEDWNALQRRGHEVMPHTWDHQDLTKVPLDTATELIDKCMRYFEAHLEGFSAKHAVYNFAFNASNPDLDRIALSRCRAVRTQGNTPINAIPETSTPVRLGCYSQGPGNSDTFVETQVNEFLASAGGWLILNLHGVDGEGWGPVSVPYLDGLLKRLVKVDKLEMMPAGAVLRRVDAGLHS